MLVEMLHAHWAHQLEERLWAGSRWQEHAMVFTTSIGTPLDGTNVTYQLHVILREAGLPRLRLTTCAMRARPLCSPKAYSEGRKGTAWSQPD
jgi:hypothetical protein